MSGRQRILLTNDDGIDAPGLRVLLEPLNRMGDVTVVAPVEEQSGVSHSIVYRRPITCERCEVPGAVAAFAVDAYPADCVKLAFDQLMPERPELVISGVNAGANIGAHLFYSGTVAAAIEASILGVPGIAVSLVVTDGPDFTRAAEIFMRVLQAVRTLDLGPNPVLNVNIPPHDLPLRGVRWTVQSPGPMPDTYDMSEDEDGRPLYRMKQDEIAWDPDEDSDRVLLGRGYVTVTPLKCDFTCHDTLAKLNQAGKLRATFDASEHEKT